MANSFFASAPYYMNPKNVVFSELAKFNPLHSELEYEATKASIMSIGQQDPIFMSKDAFGNSVCDNGRHRTQICSELGIDVMCIDLDPSIDALAKMKLCNINTTSGRDFSTSQKAVQALRATKIYGITSVAAAEMFKVDKRHVTYAATVSGYGYDEILDKLLAGESVEIEGLARPTTSIEVVCRQLKKLGEKNVVENTDEQIKWNPDALIKTEAGKQWFYEKAERIPAIKITHELIADYIELANHKFKKINTGEPQ